MRQCSLRSFRICYGSESFVEKLMCSKQRNLEIQFEKALEESSIVTRAAYEEDLEVIFRQTIYRDSRGCSIMYRSISVCPAHAGHAFILSIFSTCHTWGRRTDSLSLCAERSLICATRRAYYNSNDPRILCSNCSSNMCPNCCCCHAKCNCNFNLNSTRN